MIMKCSGLCTIFAKDKMRFGNIKYGKQSLPSMLLHSPFIIFAKDKLHTGKGNTTSHCTQSYFPGKI